jgi:hypothetical protein
MEQGNFIQGGSLAFNSGALAAGTTAGTIKTTAAINYTVDGYFLSKAITDNIAISIANPALWGVNADGSFTGKVGGTTRLLGIFLDSAGAVSYAFGEPVSTADLAAGLAPLQYPLPQRRKACIGFLRLTLTNGTTFVPGTTSLAAAGVTATFLNTSVVPSEPLRA